jgi:hypothetical protein
MENIESHGMKFMLTQSLKISTKHKTINKIKSLLFEHQQELNDLYKNHRLLMSFSKHIQIQDFPTVEQFQKEFLHQIEKYNKRRWYYSIFPKLGQKHINESILFWILESCDGVYSVYQYTNLKITDSYRENLHKAVYQLYSNIMDLSFQKNKLTTDQFIEMIKKDTLDVLTCLSEINIKINHDKSTIEYLLRKINEKRQAL